MLPASRYRYQPVARYEHKIQKLQVSLPDTVQKGQTFVASVPELSL